MHYRGIILTSIFQQFKYLYIVLSQKIKSHSSPLFTENDEFISFLLSILLMKDISCCLAQPAVNGDHLPVWWEYCRKVFFHSNTLFLIRIRFMQNKDLRIKNPTLNFTIILLVIWIIRVWKNWIFRITNFFYKTWHFLPLLQYPILWYECSFYFHYL